MKKWEFSNPNFEFDKSLHSEWWGHTFFAYDLVCNIEPETIVELGTHYGPSFLSMCQAVKDRSLSSNLYAIDSWEGDQHTSQSYSIGGREILRNLVKEIDAHYPNVNSELLKKYFDIAAIDFPEKSIDLLHIDGFHTYEAVKNDFEMWKPKLKDDAIVLFHDIHEHQKDFGVHDFWKEIKVKHKTFEFQHEHGLGVLLIGNRYDKYFSWFPQYLGIYTGKYHELKQEQVKVLKSAIKNKNEEIKKRDVAIKNKNEEIEKRDVAIKNKNEEIEKRDVAIKNKNEEIEKRDVAIKGKNEIIENLKKFTNK